MFKTKSYTQTQKQKIYKAEKKTKKSCYYVLNNKIKNSNILVRFYTLI